MKARLEDTSFLPGSCPREGLAYAVDLYGAEVDRLRKLAYDGGDHNKLVVCKLTEGQSPESSRDKRLAERTYRGCVEAWEIAHAMGAAFALYAYSTPGRNGGHHAWDGRQEAEWFLTQRARFIGETGYRPTSRPWLDFEDGKTPLGRFEAEAWCEQWLALVGGEIGCAPAFYVSAKDAKAMLPRGHRLGRFPLVDARYHNNNPDRQLNAPELPHGWTSRAGWQFTSKYRGGLDRSVVRLSALRIPQ